MEGSNVRYLRANSICGMAVTPTEKVIPLKVLCGELKVDLREARQKLRVAVKDAKKFPELA